MMSELFPTETHKHLRILFFILCDSMFLQLIPLFIYKICKSIGA